MKYLNAYCYVNGDHPKTKKALKEAIADDPESVEFQRQSIFDDPGEFPTNALYIPEGVTMQVCGPDPDNNRKWYASITFSKRAGESQLVVT